MYPFLGSVWRNRSSLLQVGAWSPHSKSCNSSAQNKYSFSNGNTREKPPIVITMTQHMKGSKNKIRSISLLKAFSCRLIPVSRQNSSICCTYCSAVPKVKSYMTYMTNCWLLLVQGHTVLSPSLTKACPV